MLDGRGDSRKGAEDTQVTKQIILVWLIEVKLDPTLKQNYAVFAAKFLLFYAKDHNQLQAPHFFLRARTS